ncbi:hypothetical protein BRADI_1g46606v3 [Brachypodium distachyon]|uniref:Uncharacterized protein n=1 Tax=Brachypodium distachyon TaxID=15368 RepID=A0A2K2DPR8_BRADI|nr:hypothetical protein BRADI_1g46606v3 [Brachypodium distachyon]
MCHVAKSLTGQLPPCLVQTDNANLKCSMQVVGCDIFSLSMSILPMSYSGFSRTKQYHWFLMSCSKNLFVPNS